MKPGGLFDAPRARRARPPSLTPYHLLTLDHDESLALYKQVVSPAQAHHNLARGVPLDSFYLRGPTVVTVCAQGCLTPG